MQENRTTSFCTGQGIGNGTGGLVCIDTRRVLDSCRDRDCFEDIRIFLTTEGEELVSTTGNLRTRSANLLWAYVSIDEVPFNCGFYRIRIRYYIEVELEACLGVGRSVTFRGLGILDKEVVLYGGEGRAVTFTSNPATDYCDLCNVTSATNDPVAVVETVEPIVLSTRISDCNCPCPCGGTEYIDIPDCVRELFPDGLVTTSTGPRVLISFGVFSVIRMERPAQLLVAATDYSVPDKECTIPTGNDNPCALFNTIAFPTAQFRGTATTTTETTHTTKRNTGGCGCNK